jgi:hypothetical protein
MAIVTSYSTLQSELKAEMDRSDDTSSPWTRFIDQAESRMRRDPRIRRPVMDSAFSISAETGTLPNGYAQALGMAHDGSTYYGAIRRVAMDELPEYKSIRGTPGVPEVFAIISRTQYQVSPVPDQTYTVSFAYYETVTKLGGAVLSNWLLDDHADIYMAACVVEAALYFRDADKAAEYQQLYDRKAEEYHRDQERHEFGGTMARTPRNAMA